MDQWGQDQKQYESDDRNKAVDWQVSTVVATCQEEEALKFRDARHNKGK
jgi:hypothetical protein